MCDNLMNKGLITYLSAGKRLSPTVCNNRAFLPGFRFPPSSPLKPYPKKPLYQRDVIKFPEWNDPPPGTSQENIPVRPIVMVSSWIKTCRLHIDSPGCWGRGSHWVPLGCVDSSIPMPTRLALGKPRGSHSRNKIEMETWWGKGLEEMRRR